MTYDFDVAKTTNQLIDWIRNYFEMNGKDCNAVIGISSGKDSTVVAALCARALGGDRVIGVLMPNGRQSDIKDSYDICDFLGIRSIELNIGDAYHDIIRQVETRSMYGTDGKFEGHIDITEQACINLPPRLRMAHLYFIAQCLNGRVSCNSNLSESYIGWCTRWADNIGDFAPIINLTSDEVIAIGDYLGLPRTFTHKAPADGLTGKTDEENFGFTYAELNRFIRTGRCRNIETAKKIISMNNKSAFKRHMPSMFFPDGLF